jgi:NAD(P)-dependent dehydrogenase (short-subunit alcohol dehydrogenase family)
MAGITAACGAIEGLTRSLAGELGRRGVRVVRAGGKLPEAQQHQGSVNPPWQTEIAAHAGLSTSAVVRAEHTVVALVLMR